MTNSDVTVLRELFNSRFDSLEAKIAAMGSSLDKDNDRQDEAIKHLADRTTHVAETKRLTERVIKIENQIEAGRSQLNDLQYKIKVTWAVGSAIGGIFLSILAAIIKGWIGV
jgi:predicted  nucleic acid-binding Zn-ribbon protein